MSRKDGEPPQDSHRHILCAGSDVKPPAHKRPANVWARKFVGDFVFEYLDCRNSTQKKGNLLDKILDEILATGCKFYSKGWVEMSKADARNRVGHWLRDAAASARKDVLEGDPNESIFSFSKDSEGASAETKVDDKSKAEKSSPALGCGVVCGVMPSNPLSGNGSATTDNTEKRQGGSFKTILSESRVTRNHLDGEPKAEIKTTNPKVASSNTESSSAPTDNNSASTSHMDKKDMRRRAMIPFIIDLIRDKHPDIEKSLCVRIAKSLEYRLFLMAAGESQDNWKSYCDLGTLKKRLSDIVLDVYSRCDKKSSNE